MKNILMKSLKVVRIIATIILVIMLAIVVLQRVTKNNLTIGKFYIFQVASASMAPVYKVGDIIVVKNYDPSVYKVGDDVTYKTDVDSYYHGIIITHRIIEANNNDGKYSFITQGIANDVADPKISADKIYGKVVYHSIILSFLGRLMQNNIMYYGLFVVVGILCAYDILKGYFIKEPETDEGEGKEE